jgi:two-component system nitrate/nitrite response regulator NarL
VSIRVLIADGHPLVRVGLRVVIDRAKAGIEIVAEAANGSEVIDLAEKIPADVFILDVAMPIMNGIETTIKLMKTKPDRKVIILSLNDSRAFVEKLIKSGARGYLLKESSSEEIVQAIRDVYAGRFYFGSLAINVIIEELIKQVHRGNKRRGILDMLTSREREILQLIAEGFSTKDVAAKLRLTLNTVHVHKKNMMQKLDIHKQADLVRYAFKEGISKL